ncbi:retrovirus-related pol polyprotein from transposon TNT 1-94 [Tanacetum coccineum]|uniref:Retrovirus-related pol polyprotein from transposon TNT 1-94 n=1 Tax=Tanacetum coccineum TaxID=301880 RepID=A0ABQ4XVG3_9ASTR
MIGYVFTLAKAPISWKSTLQLTIALSTMEAEYMAMTEAVKEAIWLQGFLGELGIKQKFFMMHSDKILEEGGVRIHKIHTSKNPADIGSDHEDANEHIEKVLEIVNLFHIPNITIDQVMLRAFPMSLTGAASRWLRNKPTGSITTWDGLKTKFLNKYCPPARTAKKMEEINNFQQEPDENLYQTW